MIASMTLLLSCQKEHQLIDTAEAAPKQKNNSGQHQAVLAKMKSSPGFGSFVKISEAKFIERKKTGCQAIPTTVGQQIVVTEVLANTVVIDLYSFYQFYSDELVESSTMQLQASWREEQKRFSNLYAFSISATTDADELGLAIISSIEVSKDQVVTFTISHKNKCRQKSVYETTYIYNSIEARHVNNTLIETLLKKTSVFSSVDATSNISTVWE